MANNTSVVISIALLAAVQTSLLKCVHDQAGKLVVSRDQWVYIHNELYSWDSKRVTQLVHPKRGVKVRVVQTAFPEMYGDRLTVFRTKWSRAELVEMLAGSVPHTYDPNNPGYTFDAISCLSPNDNLGRTFTKGAMIYRDVPSLGAHTKPETKPPWRDYNRLSPFIYITLSCSEGRLWLDQVGSDTVRE